MVESTSFSIYDASAGSGKTYTLVKEYLKIILSAKKNDAYRNILAITFTNKAVHEMKSRIVDSLSEFSSDSPSSKAIGLMEVISHETSLTIGEIMTKSRQIIKHIIHNYAAFDISTIDKFTHRVIRAFARDLNLPMNFEVSLDTENLLMEAVDALISRAGIDETLTKLLVDFTMEKTDDDKSWDISREIFDTGRMALNENNRNEISHFKEKSIEAFVTLKVQLSGICTDMETDCKGFADAALQLISDHGLEFNSFYSGYVPKHFAKISTGELIKHIGHYKYLDEVEGKRYSAKTLPHHKEAIDKIANQLLDLLTKINDNAEKYLLYKAFLKNITPLSLLNTVTNELKQIQDKQQLLSISEFNSIIHRELQNQPAPFIYERLGEKYRHYFIDEFQDTSEMQWQNLIPLIDNALSGQDESGTKGTLMIVGDPKQSIYRWRGGKAEQFIALGKDHNPFINPDKKFFTLDTNWRSFSEIVDFNNQFFAGMAAQFSHVDYADLYANHTFQKNNGKIGGYVNMRFISDEDCFDDGPTKSDLHLEAVLKTINDLVLEGFEFSDIAILTRKRGQGISVANYLTDNNIPLLSSETLLIKNAVEVRFIISMLYYIQNPSDSTAKVQFLHYIADSLGMIETMHDFIAKGNSFNDEKSMQAWLSEQLDEKTHFSFADIRKKSLYEAVELIVARFVKSPNHAYVQYFLDIVLERDVRNQAGITDFLDYWEKNSDKFSIPSPEGTNAVRILTIHKSKGLEFPVVIFPFAEEDYSRNTKDKLWLNGIDQTIDLPRILVNNSSAVENFGAEPATVYQQKKQEELLDNVNVLYVAMTRAEEQLYIISGMNLTSKGEVQDNNMSTFFLQFLNDRNLYDTQKLEYSFGNIKRLSASKNKPRKPETIERVMEILDPKGIKIAQRESLMWGTHQQESINYGNLLHEILALISNVHDVDMALQNALDSGLINMEQSIPIRETVLQVVTHPELVDYYSATCRVLNEQTIIRKNGTILKPDRISIDSNGNILLLDYKTGAHNPKFMNQLENYAETIATMGYKVSKKALVYISNEVKVVNL